MTIPAAEIILLAIALVLIGWGLSLGMRGWRRRVGGRGWRFIVAACVIIPMGLVPAVAADYVSSWTRPSFFFGDPFGRGGNPLTWYDLAAVLMLMSALLIVVWWRWTSVAPKRDRCPRCAYDTSQSGLRCPECGLEVAEPAGWMQPIRRRWPGRVAIVLFLAIYPVWVWPRIAAGGPLGAVPTWVMIVGLPWIPDSWISQPSTLATPWGNPATLSVRLQTGPEWQNALLRHRLRRMVANIDDLTVARRIIAFSGYPQIRESPTAIRTLDHKIATEQDLSAWAEWAFIWKWTNNYGTIDTSIPYRALLLSPEASAAVVREVKGTSPLSRRAALFLLDDLDPTSQAISASEIFARLSGAPSGDIDSVAFGLMQRSPKDPQASEVCRRIVLGDDAVARAILLSGLVRYTYEPARPDFPWLRDPDVRTRIRAMLLDPDQGQVNMGMIALQYSETNLCQRVEVMRRSLENGRVTWLPLASQWTVTGSDLECDFKLAMVMLDAFDTTPPAPMVRDALERFSALMRTQPAPNVAEIAQRLDKVHAQYILEPEITTLIEQLRKDAADSIRSKKQTPPEGVPSP